jgi:parallel beta-helix repeat protein
VIDGNWTNETGLGRHGIEFGGASYGLIRDNFVNVSNSDGISVSNSASNNTVINNRAYSNSSDGILIYASTNNTLMNNTAVSNYGAGIKLYNSASGNYLFNNTATGMLGDSIGIKLEYNSNNNVLTDNSGSAVLRGIFITNSSNNVFTNNTGVGNISGLEIVASNNTFIRHTAIGYYGAWISISDRITFRDCVNISTTSGVGATLAMDGASNVTFINCSYAGGGSEHVESGSQLVRKWYFDANVTNSTGYAVANAGVTAYNLTSDNVSYRTTNSSGRIERMELTEYVNYNGIRTYATPHTLNVSKTGYYTNSTSYNITTLTNVFATISLANNPYELTACGELSIANSLYVLQNNVTSSGTCFIILAQNVTLDCNGNWITYSTGGVADNYGIATSQFNATIKNCNVLDGNWSSASTSRYGILFSGNNGSIYNNFVNTSKSVAFMIDVANFNNLTNNTGISNSRQGIELVSSSDNVLTNNTGISSTTNYGIYIQGSSNNNTLTGNTGRSLSGNGIGISSASNSTFRNNFGISDSGFGIIIQGEYLNNIFINNNGTSNSSSGIFINGNNITLINNTGVSDSEEGIVLEGDSHNLLNNIGISSSDIALYIFEASNTTIIGQTAIGLSGIVMELSYNNLFRDCSNITGISQDVYLWQSMNNTFVNCSYNLSKEVINGAANYLVRKWYFDINVTNSTGYVLSNANVTLFNVSSISVDSQLTNASGDITRTEVTEYINNGTRTYATPHTLNVSKTGYYTNSTTYNITNRTNVFATIVLAKNPLQLTECGNLSIDNTVYTLQNNVTSNDTCFTIAAENVTLDCNGYWITYSISGAVGTHGILSGRFNITIKNCNILDGNWTTSNDWRNGIYLSQNRNSTLLNNFVNVSNSHAILIYTRNFSSLINNTGVSNLGVGILIYSSSNNNVLINNTGISNSGSGIDVQTNSTNNTLINNIGISNSSDAIRIYLSTNNMLINNNATSNFNAGLYIYSSSNTTLIASRINAKYAYAIRNSSNIQVYDCVYTSGSSYDVVIVSDGYSIGNNFINCSYNLSKEKLDDIDNELIRKWYFDINVTNSTGYALSNANVTLFNISSISVDSQLTNASGDIVRTEITEYVNNGTRTYATPHILNVSKTGYYINSTAYNITNLTNVFATIVLAKNPLQLTECGNLTVAGATYTLMSNVTSTGTCFETQADNVVLDCNDNWITYSTAGAADTYGIYVNQFNVTIKNCNVLDGNWTSNQTDRIGIAYWYSTENGTLFNNFVNASNSYAIILRGSANNLTSNRLFSNSTRGIDVYGTKNLFVSNNITSSGAYAVEDSGTSTWISNIGTGAGGFSLNGGGSNILINNTGIATSSFGSGFLIWSPNNNLTSNIGLAYGTEQSNAFVLLWSEAYNNLLISNNGTSTFGYGIQFYSSANNNTLINNTFTGLGDGPGIFIQNSCDNNTLINNIGRSLGDGAGIHIDYSSNITLISNNATGALGYLIRDSNYTRISDCIYTSGSTNDVQVDEGSIETVFVNCSYNTSSESVAVDSYLIRKWYFDINVTNSTGYALSNANVTLFNISSISVDSQLTNASGDIVRAEVTEYVNNGTRTYATPHTLNVSKPGYYTNSTTYNITSLTNIFATIVLNNNPYALTACGNLSVAGATYTLTSNVSSNGTCFNIQSDNMTLDCQGYYINYSLANTGYGINNSAAYDNLLVRNCNIVKGNYTAYVSWAHAIYISNNGSDYAYNNTITDTNISMPLMTDGEYSGGIRAYYARNLTINKVSLDISGSNGWGSNVLSLLQCVNVILDNSFLKTDNYDTDGIILLSDTQNFSMHNNTLISLKGNPLEIENIFNHDIDQSNTNDGYPILYNHSISNMVVLSNSNLTGTYGAVICAGCNNVTYRNVTLGGDGLSLLGTNNSLFENVTITATNGTPLWMMYSNGNSFSNLNMNVLTDNAYGMYLRTSNNNNFTGISLHQSSLYLMTSYSSTGNVFVNYNFSNVGDSCLTYSSNHSFINGIADTTFSMTGNSNVYVYNSAISSSGYHLRSSNAASGIPSIYFYNTTFNNNLSILFQQINSSAYLYEYVDVNVTSANVMLSGANITAKDTYDILQASNISSGTNLARLTLLTKKYNYTANVTYNNYTLNVTAASYAANWTTINITNSSKYTGGNHVLLVLRNTAPPSITFEEPPTPVNGSTVNSSTQTIVANITDPEGSNTSSWIDFDRSLIGYWAMDYYNASGIYDNSTYGRFGIFQGEMGAGDVVTGKRGDALKFNGSDEYAEVGTINDMGQEFTLSFWMNITGDNSSTYSVPFAEASGWGGGPGSQGFFIDIADSNVAARIGNHSDDWNEALAWFYVGVPYNTWQFYTVVWDYPYLVTYTNGDYFWNTTFNHYIANDWVNTVIGAWVIGSNPFNGSLDEVMLFNRGLSQTEVSALYNSKVNKFNATFANLSVGQHNYTVYATDETGNLNSSGMRNFTVNDTTPPSITFESPTPDNDTTVNVSTQTIVANITDPEGSNTSSWIDFDRSLLAYWAMDYYNDSGIYDNSTYHNFGTFDGGIGTSNLTAGVRGNALTFNGISDNINLGDDTLDMGTNNFTLAAWVKTDTVDYWKGIIAKGGSGGAGYALLLSPTGIPDFSIQYDVNTHITAVNEIDDNNWHHVVMSADRGGDVYIYIDSILDKQADISSQSGSTNNDANLRLGSFSDGAQWLLNGSLDEIMIFNRTLSQTEVKALYNSKVNKFNATFSNLSLGQHNYTMYAVDESGNLNSSGLRNFTVNDIIPPFITFEYPTPDDGATVNVSTQTITANITDPEGADTSSWIDFDRSLVGYWAMDYYNDSGIYDNSTYSNFGTFYGGLNSSNLTTGARGLGLTFDGEDDILNLNDISGIFDFGKNDFTISWWMKASGDGGAIAKYSSATGIGFILPVNNNSLYFRDGTDDLMLISSVNFLDDNLKHVVTKRNSTGFYVYVDGIQTGFNAGSSIDSLSDSTVALWFGTANLAGGYWSGSYDYVGLIDEVMIFNRSLSEMEISALYNSQINKFNATFTGLAKGQHNYTVYAVDEAGNLNSSGLRNFTYDSGETPSNITYVMSIGNVDPIESSLRIIAFNFTVNDAEGNNTINVSSAIVRVNSSGIVRQSASCLGIPINATAQNISCNVSLQYYDPAGVWNVNVSIEDTLGNYTRNVSTTFVYNVLYAVSLNTNNLNFGTLNAGDVNRTTGLLQLNNTGNFNYTLVQLKAYNLMNGSDMIVASNFRINITNSSVGTVLSNNTFVNITGATLPRSTDTSIGNQSMYIYLDIPLGTAARKYSSPTAWTLSVN